MSDRVIIYGLSGWPYTIRAREAYKEHEFYSVIKDQRKLAEMLKISNGKRQVPVIVEGDKVNIGYGGTWCFWFSGRVCWEESSIDRWPPGTRDWEAAFITRSYSGM